MFIVFEGNDGSGKATQARLLEEAFGEELQEPCYAYAFPQYDQSFGGRLLAGCLAGVHGNFVHLAPELAALPYALDRFESSAQIHGQLDQGFVVIADRYAGSNQIHQGGKLPEGEREAYLAWLDELEHGLLENPKPDLVIYLRASVELSLQMLAHKRASKGGVLEDGHLDQVESDRTYLENSHAMANWLAARDPAWKIVECANADGSLRTPEEIHADVWAIVKDALGLV